MTTDITGLEHVRIDWESAKKISPAEFSNQFEIQRVPTASGCYLMHDANDRIIYIGKAKNLRARLRSYLNESDTRYTVKFLMARVSRIDFLITKNDKEALLLENSLIKQHKPRYNIQLRDDKTYVSLKVNVRHDFPRVTVTRKLRKDGSKYFGPYSSAGAVRETVRQIQRVFPLRTCSDNVLNNRVRPCLYYQMKRCTAPCVGYMDKAAYAEIVEQVLLLLAGRSADVEKLIRDQMRECADQLEFEKAADLRDRLAAIQRTMERQRTVAVPGAQERDVFGVYTKGRFSEIQAIFYRGGKMMGGRSFSFNRRETPLDEMFSSFLLQYYADSPNVPSEIVLPVAIEDADVLEEILGEKREARVHVVAPQRGEKRAMVDLANRNAKTSFEEKQLTDQANSDLIDQIKEKLYLPITPNRIECFDISTTQGAKPVGSMVTFEGGVANKSRYRRYAIKEVEGQDDFAMMREVLMRRLKRAIEEDDLPDLILVDGGKGQLGVATTVFKDLGIDQLPAASIAKSRTEGSTRSPERFFIPGRSNPIVLPQHSPIVNYLAQIRDEAHRFAITYHRKRRNKATLSTRLTGIPGVGAKRARLLLKEIGSVDKIMDADVGVIAALPGFGDALAQTIKDHLKRA
jgi:excinuclease ABC subunit C